MTKVSIFNSLIFLSLICFGTFGSLSHLFNLGLVLLLAWNYFNSKNEFLIDPSAKKLYFALCAVFFIFLIRGLFHSDAWVSIQSLSPMMSIPIIGLMILLTPKNSFHISGQRLANYAKISIAVTFTVYIIFSQFLAFQFNLTENFRGRLEIFSGNPVPFSMAVFGVSIFCLANWRFSKNSDKLVAIICLLIGFWLAGIASGTRGTLVAIILVIPIVIWFVTQSFSLTLLTVLLTIITFWLVYTETARMFNSIYTERLFNGIDTALGKNDSDSSMKLKIEMWASSVSAIKDNIFWGYDNSNRFKALTMHLPEGFKRGFTHPHNDILASLISSGLLGGILSIFSLLSPVWAGLLSKQNTLEKLVLGILIFVGVVITANINTIFFNDITAAWLAFSTFLIWNINYDDNDKEISTL